MEADQIWELFTPMERAALNAANEMMNERNKDARRQYREAQREIHAQHSG